MKYLGPGGEEGALMVERALMETRLEFRVKFKGCSGEPSGKEEFSLRAL